MKRIKLPCNFSLFSTCQSPSQKRTHHVRICGFQEIPNQCISESSTRTPETIKRRTHRTQYEPGTAVTIDESLSSTFRDDSITSAF